MKRDQLTTLRAAAPALLAKKVTELQLTLDRARVNAAFGQVKNHREQRALRRQLAQLKTILTERSAPHSSPVSRQAGASVHSGSVPSTEEIA